MRGAVHAKAVKADKADVSRGRKSLQLTQGSAGRLTSISARPVFCNGAHSLPNSSCGIPLATSCLSRALYSAAQVWGENRWVLLLMWNNSSPFSTIKMSSISTSFRHVMPADPEVPRKSPIGDQIGLLWSGCELSQWNILVGVWTLPYFLQPLLVVIW